jgi:hypothetical protein
MGDYEAFQIPTWVASGKSPRKYLIFSSLQEIRGEDMEDSPRNA